MHKGLWLLVVCGVQAPLTTLAAPAPYCAGEYADDFAALSAKAREFEVHRTSYAYCVRTTATYECPYYAGDGVLHRTRKKVTAHGTAFAYKQSGGETLLLTNQHVAEWPVVTDDEHPVEDVPAGCKRVADAMRIVDNEDDAFERDDIALQRVVADPQLDVAVLKTKATLSIMPWKIGHSAGLHERNVVDVRGFPLGAFKATNVGKVISVLDHDDFKDWDHDDFVVDALLSPGNSGSPVLAISCRTGEFELVGIYHAGYLRGSALNVVVGIDQVRDLMTTLHRSAKKGEGPAALDAQARVTLAAGARGSIEPFFAFGQLPAAVRVRSDGALVYEVLDKDFPFDNHAIAVLEDLPPQPGDTFGTVGRVWFGNRQGLKPYLRGELDGEAKAMVTKLVEALRRDSLATFAWRTADRRANSSREHHQTMERLERTVRKAASSRKELAQSLGDLAERLGPHDAEEAARLADALSVPDAALVQAIETVQPPAGPTGTLPARKTTKGSDGPAKK
jgi:serine protease Do